MSSTFAFPTLAQGGVYVAITYNGADAVMQGLSAVYDAELFKQAGNVMRENVPAGVAFNVGVAFLVTSMTDFIRAGISLRVLQVVVGEPILPAPEVRQEAEKADKRDAA
jgi:hypothetical protein